MQNKNLEQIRTVIKMFFNEYDMEDIYNYIDNNISMNEIIDENEMEYLSLRYDEDILKNLTTKSLTSMDFGSDIFIFINKKSDNEEILEVKIEFYLENDIDKLEKSFLKYKWMEYYE